MLMLLAIATILLPIPLLLFTTTHNGQGNDDFCTWNNCPKWSQDEDAINVHLICHTHDDMGWLKSADEYYTGARASIFNVGVQYILSTVVAELAKHPDRRFSYAETGFLTQWLEDKSPEEVEMLRKLVVDKGQLEFIGGGWTQPDEATTHYVDLIDQYTLGLGKLSEKYGKCGIPKIAWQIDPFGHSVEHANLVAQMAYEALFFARMHYAELQERAKNKSLEMLWKIDANRTLFTATFLRGTYGQPEGFCFDPLCGDFEPIIDDPDMDGYNLDRKLTQFFDIVQEQVQAQRHRHVLIAMGNDFTYSNAAMWFTNLDRLIRAANKISPSTGVHLFYSTPTCYLKALQGLNGSVDFPQRDQDFFPYASNGNAYWTGYFTSKPALKGMVRQSSALLQLTRQFEALIKTAGKAAANDGGEGGGGQEVEKLERAQALSTHHDAVTGTSKEAVTQNYEYRLLKGWDGAERILEKAMNVLAKKGGNGENVPEQKMCRRLNESYCRESMENGHFPVTIFNGNGHKFEGIVRIPINGPHAKVLVGVGGMDLVQSKVMPTFVPQTQQANGAHFQQTAKHELMFNAEVGPLGFSTYFVEKSPEEKKQNGKNMEEKNGNGTGNTIENNLIRLEFDNANGMVNAFVDLKTGTKFAFTQQFLAYVGGSSGAYLFRPTQSAPVEFNGKIKVEFVKNELVEEARQTISPWISQVVRLYRDKPYVEFQFLVGPLPKNESLPIAHEIVSRYSMPAIKSAGKFWTDSNGRQMIERRRNHSKWFEFEETNAVTGNYYPVNNRIFLADQQTQLTIVTDRAQGGTSLRDGQLELMLHRRCFQDDGLGVAENLDEPGEDGRGLVLRGIHWLHVGRPNDDSMPHRQLAMEIFHQPVLTFSNFTGEWADYTRKYGTQFSALSSELPANVNLLTMKHLGRVADNGILLLLRFEHIYAPNEHPLLGQPVRLNLQTLFARLKVRSARELSLAANFELDQPMVDVENVLLEPMQIRTFQITLE